MTLQVLTLLGSLAGFLLIADKRRVGWPVNLVSQVGWLYILWQEALWGLWLYSLFYTVTCGYGCYNAYRRASGLQVDGS